MFISGICVVALNCQLHVAKLLYTLMCCTFISDESGYQPPGGLPVNKINNSKNVDKQSLG